jgi:putative NADH-flavin reductase
VDIFNEDDLAPHLKDSDAVVSCLGGSASLFGWTKCTLYTDSMRSIVGAMRKSGVKRLIAMSSWGSAGGVLFILSYALFSFEYIYVL